LYPGATNFMDGNCLRLRLNLFYFWIPAFAGMAVEVLII